MTAIYQRLFYDRAVSDGYAYMHSKPMLAYNHKHIVNQMVPCAQVYNKFKLDSVYLNYAETDEKNWNMFASIEPLPRHVLLGTRASNDIIALNWCCTKHEVKVWEKAANMCKIENRYNIRETGKQIVGELIEPFLYFLILEKCQKMENLNTIKEYISQICGGDYLLKSHMTLIHTIYTEVSDMYYMPKTHGFNEAEIYQYMQQIADIEKLLLKFHPHSLFKYWTITDHRLYYLYKYYRFMMLVQNMGPARFTNVLEQRVALFILIRPYISKTIDVPSIAQQYVGDRQHLANFITSHQAHAVQILHHAKTVLYFN
jgi:hypothetical protein